MPINFKNVFYSYSSNTPFANPALEDVTLTIKDGSFTCIVGQTGCGKSTLIQQLNGLLIPTAGSVEVNEYHIEKKSKSLKKLYNLRKEVGIVFQFSEYQLFEETIVDDVAFGPINYKKSKEEAIEIAKKCLKTVGIPESYYEKSPFELSGGEKRRVAIAGILALEPKVLILDEPTAGLDPQGSKEMLNLFKKLNELGTTIILVTHDINIVYEYATNVVVMSKHKVIMDTTPSELFKCNLEEYSLETPLIQKTINMLLDKGMNIDTANIRNLEDLAREIKRARK